MTKKINPNVSGSAETQLLATERDIIQLNKKLNHVLKKLAEPIKQKTSTSQTLMANLNTNVELLIKIYLDLQHKYLSSLAEHDNMRKRHNKELRNACQYQSFDIAQKLIPILDNFERAVEVPNSQPEVQNFLSGFKMIYKLILDVFAKEGIKLISVQKGDSFDHNLHEAIAVKEHDQMEENQIADVTRKGYILGDRVVRHTAVVVVKKPKQNKKQNKNIN